MLPCSPLKTNDQEQNLTADLCSSELGVFQGLFLPHKNSRQASRLIFYIGCTVALNFFFFFFFYVHQHIIYCRSTECFSQQCCNKEQSPTQGGDRMAEVWVWRFMILLLGHISHNIFPLSILYVVNLIRWSCLQYTGHLNTENKPLIWKLLDETIADV